MGLVKAIACRKLKARVVPPLTEFGTVDLGSFVNLSAYPSNLALLGERSYPSSNPGIFIPYEVTNSS